MSIYLSKEKLQKTRVDASDWLVAVARKGAIALSAAFTLSACSAPVQQSQSLSAPQANADKLSPLPTMTAYTRDQVKKGRPVVGGLADLQPAGKPLTAGQHCFHKASGNSWLSIRLNLADNQRIRGESAGTVNHPAKGETRYQQTFMGSLAGKQALLVIDTQIAGISEERQEAWTIDANKLDMGRVVIGQVPCLQVSDDF